MPTKVALFGAGAIGTIYVYLLTKAGCEVTAVCRSNYDAAKQDGFHIESKFYGEGVHHVRPQVIRTPSEAVDEKFDYVLVTAKALPQSNNSSLIQPLVTAHHTTIVLIENGIGIEKEYAVRFPNNTILSCVVYLPVTQTSPGHVFMNGPEALQIGTYPATKTAGISAQRLIELLTSAGGNPSWYADVQEKRWEKLLLNAPWNPICALTLSRDVAYLQSSAFAESTVAHVLKEVITICNALGYSSINDDLADRSLAQMKGRIGTIGIGTSMMADVLGGRKMEVECILGEPVRVAKELGVAVPRLEMLYVLTKALDEAIQWRKEGQAMDGDDVKRAREAMASHD